MTLCKNCDRPIDLKDNEWVHPVSKYAWENRCKKPAPDSPLSKADHTLIKLIAENAIERNGAWVATLPEKTSKTGLKKLCRMGRIEIRTVAYAPWKTVPWKTHSGWNANHNWGTPPHKNQLEVLLLDCPSPSTWEEM